MNLRMAPPMTCLSAYVCYQDNAKRCRLILTNCFGGVGCAVVVGHLKMVEIRIAMRIQEFFTVAGCRGNCTNIDDDDDSRSCRDEFL